MSRSSILLKLFALLGLQQAAQACSEFKWQWTTDDWIAKPEAIYFGEVVSIEAPRDYINDGETDPLMAAVSLGPCQGGLPNYLDDVVLFRVGSVWHAKLLNGKHESDELADAVYRTLSKHRKT